MTLTAEELIILVARCDKLKPLIEKLDETEKKVFLKKSRNCKDMYPFVLESRKAE